MDRVTAAAVFVQIVDRASMAAAAEALDMSRAMVTRYLAQMESWAGARLLHRTTRRLSLTAAGELALARSRRLLAVADEMAVAPPDDAQAVQGALRIACSQALAQETLAPLMVAFLQRHPLASIDLRIDPRAVNLVAERIDLAIRITNELDPNLFARRLGDCESVVCAAPDYLTRRGTPQRPQDLATHNCLTYSYFGRGLWEFEAVGGGSGKGRARSAAGGEKGGAAGGSSGRSGGAPVGPAIRAPINASREAWVGASVGAPAHAPVMASNGGLANESVSVPVAGNLSGNESNVLLAAALNGAGVTLQPVLAVAELLAAGRLVALLPGWTAQTMGVHAVFKSHRHMPPVLRVLLDFLAEQMPKALPTRR